MTAPGAERPARADGQRHPDRPRRRHVTDLKISPRLLARDDSLAGTSASRLIELRRTFDPGGVGGGSGVAGCSGGTTAGNGQSTPTTPAPARNRGSCSTGTGEGGKGIVIIRYTGPTFL